MSQPKRGNYHLGPLGTFHSGSGQDVDFVFLPATVISRAAGFRVECKNEDDLRAALTVHWKASHHRFNVDAVLKWAMDHSAPMGPAEVTSGMRHVAVDVDWLRM